MKYILFLVLGCIATEGCAPEIIEKETVYTVQIEDHTITTGSTEETKTDSVAGAVVGGGVAGVAAHATGIANPIIATAVGAAAGGIVGGQNKEKSTSNTASSCRFRVSADNQILGYYSEKPGSWSYQGSFGKCLILRNGDPVEVVKIETLEDGKSVDTIYMWKIGGTEIRLQ